MQKILKRCAAVVLCLAALVGGGFWYLNSHLPSTFMVPQGQGLSLAQMPWLVPQQQSGYAQAQATAAGSSYNATLSVFGKIPVKAVRVVVVDRRSVTVCGTPFGIKMFSDGALIVAFSDIRTQNGYANPAKDAGLRMGDRICLIGDAKTTSNEDVKAAIQNSKGAAVQLTYIRDDKTCITTLQPVQSADGSGWHAGMWVRDSSAGIGTLTFVDNAAGVYGGLGHSISDSDTGQRITLLSGEIAPVTISGYRAGSVGSPGELKGRFTGDLSMGNILINDATGVYGSIRTVVNGTDMIVAQAQEVQQGKAQIITTIEGTTPAAYEVQIEKVSLAENDPNRNMVIRVTDKALLAKTGGIVQGMSGSPIVQNGRLVGAVTHVLVNDPTRGFGIFAENMIKSVDATALKAA